MTNANRKPRIPGYYTVRSSSGEGERVWQYDHWWQQDYRMQWMPMEWVKGELSWRGPKTQPRIIPPPYIRKP